MPNEPNARDGLPPRVIRNVASNPDDAAGELVEEALARELLGKALNLKEHQRIVLAQSVGYPAGHAQKF